MATKSDEIATMRKRYEDARDAVAELYDAARSDIAFVTIPGEQWDSDMRARRDNRPCYEFPKLNGMVRQIVNDMKQSRPQGKVRGMEDGDEGLAELMQGLCYNIEAMSDSREAYDTAFDAAVKGGFGAWRITTEYADDGSFNQDIYIRAIRNPFCVKFDPAAIRLDRSDMGYCFVEELVPRETFERDHPDVSITDFFDDAAAVDWRDENKVRVAEYWYKRPLSRALLALSDGRVVFEDSIPGGAATLAANGVEVIRKRTVKSHKVFMRQTNGVDWLTEETEFPSQYIPILPLWGNITNIDGKDYWYGSVRACKDMQRLHNMHRTATIEAVAKAPKAPFVGPLEAIAGLEDMWKKANTADYPYLPYKGQVRPQRTQQAEIPAALISLANIDDADMRAATGMFEAALGMTSNEVSGKAILQRRKGSNVATYNYMANLSASIRQTYRILIDMVPRVYDTPRAVRILGNDGAANWVQLYQTVQDPATGQLAIVNDITKGKYDATVSIGPNYDTQRMEAVEFYTSAAASVGGAYPPLSALLAYAAMENIDEIGSRQITAAMKRLMIKQGLIQPGPEDHVEPEQPNPLQMIQVQKGQADVAKSQATTEKIKAQTMHEMVEARLAMPKAEAELESGQAQTRKTFAEIDKLIAETVDQRIQNMIDAGLLPVPQSMPPSVPIRVKEQPV